MMTIVLVDDNPDDLTLLRTALTARADEVAIESHTSAAAALDWFAHRRPSELADILVLTDLNMPVIDGADLIAEINRRYEPAPVSVVMSTSSRPGDITRSYAAGANAYHAKPMGFHETADLCGTILDYWKSTTYRPAVNPS